MNRPAASLLVVLLVVTSFAGACGSDSSDGDSASTTAVSSTTSGPGTNDSAPGSPTTQPDPGTVTSTTTATTTIPGSTAPSGAQPVDPAWALYDDEFYVWGVADDDVLNVRQGPGVGHPVIVSFEPGQRGIRRYDTTRQANGGSWGPVAVPGGVGWVNLAYLRPEGSRPPRTEGTIEPSVETAADDVQALLGAVEYETLSGFIDPTRGVTISLHAFVADDAVVLTPRQVVDSAEERELFLWGYTDGEGRAVKTTIGTSSPRDCRRLGPYEYRRDRLRRPARTRKLDRQHRRAVSRLARRRVPLRGDLALRRLRLEQCPVRLRRYEDCPERSAGSAGNRAGHLDDLSCDDRTLGPGGGTRSVLGCSYDTEPLAP